MSFKIIARKQVFIQKKNQNLTVYTLQGVDKPVWDKTYNATATDVELVEVDGKDGNKYQNIAGFIESTSNSKLDYIKSIGLNNAIAV